MTPYRVVFVTAQDEAEADKIGRRLLDKRLAACVNILSGVRSLFWWEGKIDEAREVLLVIKSREEHVEAVIRCVKECHSYDVPEILALPVVKGSETYLQWMDANL